MPYRNWADTDVLNAADLNAMTADAQKAFVATAEGTTSGSYGDLTTVGPSVTVTLVSGQGALVIGSARLGNDAGTNTTGAMMSYAVSGAGTQAGSDDHSVEAILTEMQLTFVDWFIAGASGSFTFKLVYKRSGVTGNANFGRRKIVVKKF
jgi:hypothetical protein